MDNARTLIHTALVYNPMVAGLVLMRTRVNMLTFSVTRADMWLSVLYGAYVHEALKLKEAGSGEGQVADSWPLMRQFIDLHSSESNFFGREPDSLRSQWTGMNLAFGTLSFKDLQVWQESSRSA
ncbi:hypothetical protein BCR44DRAFT_37797 [Catenaria anguillulae PL171]|uniref:Uncharacterized protein n=1 Tax=Catenaria anguillulae PL171 TaxID=765915 RepID=A0A1Y2HXI8_9FUNG|nr:hypothetical protein BCR44DRAFT_37797 [Catenaria anguillulae PL171]